MSSDKEGDRGGDGKEKDLDMEFTKEEREAASKLLARVVSCNKCVKRIRRRMLEVKQRAIKVTLSLVTHSPTMRIF